LLSNYDENVPKFFCIYNKIRRAQRTYPTFFLIFFSVALELRQSKKPEELLELMTRAIQNTGLLWPLRARSQPPCRFYFRETRRFETLHEHPKQQFDDAVKLPRTTNLRRALMAVLIKDALIPISLGNFPCVKKIDLSYFLVRCYQEEIHFKAHAFVINVNFEKKNVQEIASYKL